MKIFCIVYYKSIRENKKIQSALLPGILSNEVIEPHLEKIQLYSSDILAWLKNNDGIHTLKQGDGVCYAYLKGDQLAIVTVDQALSAMHRYSLFEKIFQAANEKELKALVYDPVGAVKSKEELAREQLEEIAGIMRANVEKIIERDLLLNDLVIKTEELKSQTFKFSRRSADLHNQTRCPGLFGFFKSIRDAIWSDEPDNNYEYDYEPLSTSKL